MLKYFIILLFGSLLFTGCAPEYMVKNIYIPPIGNKAKICLDDCSVKKQNCLNECKINYDRCLDNATKRAKDIKALMDIEYNKRYKKYLAKYNNYKLAIIDWQHRYDQSYRDWRYFGDICKKSKDRYACERANELKYFLKKMFLQKPKTPKPPKKPNLYDIITKECSICKSDCRCDKEYDICFLNCGGEIQLKKICIANCNKK